METLTNEKLEETLKEITFSNNDISLQINNDLPHIIVLCGISGSGKSTFATEFIKNNPSYLRVNRDDIRKTLVGKLTQDYYKRSDLKQLESIVSTIQNETIRIYLHQSFNVLIDNTHLQNKYIDEILLNYNHLANIELKFFDCDKEIAKLRVVLRDNETKDVSYIDRHFKEYEKLKNNILGKLSYGKRLYPKKDYTIKQNKDLPKAIICDLDGTLCLFGNKNPYQRDFENDELNLPVFEIISNYYGFKETNAINGKDASIFFFSGRNEKYRKQTVEFLSKLLYPEDYTLVMRKDDDMRKDDKVKLDMFNEHIKDKYYVDFVIDDRKQVKRMWVEKLGLFVFDVNQIDKIF